MHRIIYIYIFLHRVIYISEDRHIALWTLYSAFAIILMAPPWAPLKLRMSNRNLIESILRLELRRRVGFTHRVSLRGSGAAHRGARGA